MQKYIQLMGATEEDKTNVCLITSVIFLSFNT